MHQPKRPAVPSLDAAARATVLIRDAQALLDSAGPTLVSAHLQHALDLLHGEPRLVSDSAAAAWIDARAEKAETDF